MIKAVLDTNVMISAVFWSGKPYQVLTKGLQGKYQPVTSPEIIEEVANKLRKKFNFPEDKIDEQINIMLTLFHVITPTAKIDVVRDKSDNKIIECAIESKSEFVITGDPDLLVIKEYESIKIVTPEEFLRILKG